MLNIITGIITVGIIVSFVLTIISRLLPNEKLYNIGFKFGKSATLFGSRKLGCEMWTNIENFFIESFQHILSGLHDGLRFDNEDAKRKEYKSAESKIRT